MTSSAELHIVLSRHFDYKCAVTHVSSVRKCIGTRQASRAVQFSPVNGAIKISDELIDAG